MPVDAQQENTKSVEQLIHLFHALQVNRLEQQVLDNMQQPDQNEMLLFIDVRPWSARGSRPRRGPLL